MNSLFVTVGTTMFDELVDKVLSLDFLLLLKRLGFNRLVLQHGKSRLPDWMKDGRNSVNTGITIEAYDFKPSLQKDMKQSTHILSHSGAGTILDALYLHKPLLVVINESLMDNHQEDLATVLEDYLHHSRVEKIGESFEKLVSIGTESLQYFNPPNPSLMNQILLEAME